MSVSGLEVRGVFLSLPLLLLLLLIGLFTGNGLYNSLALGSRASLADRTSYLKKGCKVPEKRTSLLSYHCKRQQADRQRSEGSLILRVAE